MSSIHLWLLAFSLAFTLAGCDNSRYAAAKNTPKVADSGEPVVEIPQALKLSVNESILKGLENVSDEPITLSDSVELQIKPVKDQQRLSVNGRLLLQDTWQANYLDNIVGGKVELQLRFDD
jgi:hypothetical protein